PLSAEDHIEVVEDVAAENACGSRSGQCPCSHSLFRLARSSCARERAMTAGSLISSMMNEGSFMGSLSLPLSLHALIVLPLAEPHKRPPAARRRDSVSLLCFNLSRRTFGGYPKRRAKTLQSLLSRVNHVNRTCRPSPDRQVQSAAGPSG